jgi:hypothetical protein
MASKNLGAVIQRAISDGAFRRQLQSDPAAALRGFNLTPDEVAAIRSGDSSKLMSLGVDQRMSKAFTVSGGLMGATRATTSDLAAGGTASTVANDNTAGTREGIVGDPASSSRDALTTGNVSGTRAVVDSAPFDSRATVSDPTVAGTRAIHDDAPADLRAAATTGDLSGVRAVNDVAPFGSTGTSAIEDPNAPEFGRGAVSTGDFAANTRAVNDVAPFGSTGTSAIEDPNAPEFGRIDAGAGSAGSAAVNDPYSGQYQGVSPDFQARLGQASATDGGAGASGGSMISADDNYAVSSRMADAGDATSIRPINDVAPFEGNVNAAATGGGEFLGGDARLDPGTDSAHGFIPSDSADVQRVMLDGTGHGDALGNTGGGGNTSS